MQTRPPDHVVVIQSKSLAHKGFREPQLCYSPHPTFVFALWPLRFSGARSARVKWLATLSQKSPWADLRKEKEPHCRLWELRYQKLWHVLPRPEVLSRCFSLLLAMPNIYLCDHWLPIATEQGMGNLGESYGVQTTCLRTAMQQGCGVFSTTCFSLLGERVLS